MIGALLRDTASCERLLADHLAAAVQRFGAAALSVIDLPPLDDPGARSSAQLNSAAALLWLQQIDAGGLLECVDAIARGVTDGSLQLPVSGDVIEALVRYHRGREERFDSGERAALYAGLFGSPNEPAHPVPSLFAAFCRALIALGSAPHLGEQRLGTIRVGTTAQQLAAALSERAVGIVGFAAREIAAQARDALALLADPELSRALGGIGVDALIRIWSLRLLGRTVNPSGAVRRARAGLTLVQWLAANAVHDDLVSIDPGDELIAAAATFVESSP